MATPLLDGPAELVAHTAFENALELEFVMAGDDWLPADPAVLRLWIEDLDRAETIADAASPGHTVARAESRLKVLREVRAVLEELETTEEP